MDPTSLAAMLGTSALSGGLSFLGGQQQNAANAQQAMQQDAFAEGMFNTTTAVNQANTRQAQDWTSNQYQHMQDFNAGQAALNRQFQTGSQAEAERFNAQQQQVQNAFNLQTSSTAYQRAVADMKKAGLNPILSAGTGGSPVSSVSPGSVSGAPGSAASAGAPSSSGASAGTATLGAGARYENTLGAGVASAQQASKLVNDFQGLQSTIKTQTSQQNLTNEQTKTQTQLTEKAQNDAAVSAAQLDLTQASALREQANAKNIAAQTKALQTYGPNPSFYNPATWGTVLSGLGSSYDPSKDVITPAVKNAVNKLMENLPSSTYHASPPNQPFLPNSIPPPTMPQRLYTNP